MTSTGFEKTVITEHEVQKLWETFQIFDADSSNVISSEELGQVMRSLGQSPSEIELRDMIKEVDVDRSGAIDFEEFKTLMLSQQGDRQSRLALAFSVFDENNSGKITKKELHNVMSRFSLTDQELDEILQEVDDDGDGQIDFEEFCELVLEETEIKTGYKDLPLRSVPTQAQNPTPITTEQKSQTPTTPIETETAQLKGLLAKHPQSGSKRGTSRLQMQIGLFRLLQGAAYRSFRESFSANHETHLRVRDLPYKISDFVEFVKEAIALYKGLDIVEPACHPLLDAVVQSVTDEYTRLEERIAHWQTIQKTPEMLAEEQAMRQTRSQSASLREKFTAGVEFAITLKKKHFSLKDIAEGVLAVNELNRLRQIELAEELTPSSAPSIGDPKEYLKKWNRVILGSAEEEIDGAMMPVAYWYEDFMPKLLAAFSVGTAAEIQDNISPHEVALNQWYEETKAKGEFERHGTDIVQGFFHCSPQQKLMIQQAWRLTHYYLNGLQKRRERQDFGRDSGIISQYVAFIDIPLGRSDIKDAQMRVSFPYYLGPAVWRFFHTTAEIVCTKTSEEQQSLARVFQEFFKRFATMYPCPYCRHHLNYYVVQNKEIDMYPVEYLLLGREQKLADFGVSMEAKLSTVVDGSSMRLFFWKLHNTVSSSIARTEEWYQKDEKAFYTTRYWPSLDSELAYAKASGQVSIATERLTRLYGMLKPASRLAGVRETLQKLLEDANTEDIGEICQIGQNYIMNLEQALVDSQFLQETYHFNPSLVDQAPSFTPEEEAFARSGIFVESVVSVE